MPLRYLFVDMNSYFASVEQQDRPRLRGRPVAVVPVQAQTTCCLAASYEAKAFGVKTGTPVWRARALCRDLECVPARPARYVEIHHEIVRAVGRCVPVDRVLSVDEMACKLLGDERKPENAAKIAAAIKAAVAKACGRWMRCSVGVAPNGLLAKVASDMRKPDGLTVIRSEELPARLHALKLTDFPGIGPRMEKCLHLHNVFTAERLCALSVQQLSRVWGSRVHGERWYYQLRGDEVHEKPAVRRTLGQSNVLPPEHRTDAGSRAVLVRLIHKACGRLRDVGHWAGHLHAGVNYLGAGRRGWEASTPLSPCQDTLTVLQAFAGLWGRRPRDADLTPLKVAVTLTRLTPTRATTLSLFDEDRNRTALAQAMDAIKKCFGRNSVYFGALSGAEDAAPLRIPFGTPPVNSPAYQ